jgi:glycosyltransferase involved in cell wall biosynthesis
MRRLFISAFGIHTGGGLVLLDALLKVAPNSLDRILLDIRLAQATALQDLQFSITFVRRSFLARMQALAKLVDQAEVSDIILCFNSLPPLLPSKAYVVTYVQAPHFVGAHSGIRYHKITWLRMLIERAWFSLSARNSNEFWVQTETMGNALRQRYPRHRIEIIPLVDDFIASTSFQKSNPVDILSHADTSFFYPADGVGHKNHRNLLLAWNELAKIGKYPKLILTLREAELKELAAREGVTPSDKINIQYLGRISRKEVLDQMANVSALVFPSLVETFGLPLLEARSMGKPIIASERDFVRDLCIPQETFDPESPRSIARAILRFIDRRPDLAGHFYSPSEFFHRLLRCNAAESTAPP